MFKFNAQHDCAAGKCAIKLNAREIRQERQVTTQTQAALVHTNDDKFIVNMHALHNAHRIRETLPRHLTAPIPYLQDRKAKHCELALHLRATEAKRRAETAAKSKATREKKKQQRTEQQATQVPVLENAPMSSRQEA